VESLRKLLGAVETRQGTFLELKKINTAHPKILFINNTSKMGAGTSQSLCLLLKYLDHTYNISVISDRESQELPQALTKLNIPHYAYHDRTLLFLPELIFLILTQKIDLVYGNNLSGRAQVAFWAAKITGCPYIWHIRESLIANDKRGKDVDRANAVIANSVDTARRLMEFAGVKASFVIPNGVELEAFESDRDYCRQQLINQLGCASGSIFVINLGRICEQKNQPEAVRVGIKVLERYPQTHFLFLGDLQDSDYLNQMTQEIGTTRYQDHFHILGHINDFIPYLLGSDILLHTARREPQGRVILEAMAARLPVVAYEIGGVGEAVVQGKTGFLRPWGDIEGLVSDISDLLVNKNLRQEMGNAGYLRVQEQFTAINTALQIKDVIEKVICNFKERK
jgi:glycosyltransferase involved in cell wall biosynthesis